MIFTVRSYFINKINFKNYCIIFWSGLHGGGVNGSKRERGCSVCGKSFVQSNACNFTKNIECKGVFIGFFLPCYANDHVHFISCSFARCSLGEVNNGSYPIPIPGIPSPRCHIYAAYAKCEVCGKNVGHRSHLYNT